MPRNPLRAKLQSGQPACGLWVTLASPSITEIAVLLGLDWVVIEMEHGDLDFHDVMGHVRAVRGSDTAVLVRVPETRQETLKRALDIGAHGVIVPMVRGKADVELAYKFGRYPPRGVRGVGGERAVKWGVGLADYVQCANEETLIIPLIETRDAVEEMDGILNIPGLEAIWFGPADMSSSYGYLGEWEGPGVAERILDIRAKAAAKGIAAGIMARTVEESKMRRDQGFSLIALGADTTLLIRALRENLNALGRPVQPKLWF
jgi:2-keto-3-deoxy-L-rhamnonate aldolase RhmA